MSVCLKLTTKKYTCRPSPPYPANECRDLTKKGNDGQIYKSVANLKGVYQWKLRNTKTTVSATGMHRIFITEPYTERKYKRDNKKSFIYHKHVLNVTQKFYEILLKKPKYVVCDRGNSYIFGPKFPIKDYIYVTGHGNDGAQTGLLDYDKWLAHPEDQSYSDLWHRLYLTKGKMLPWDNRAALKKMQAAFPEIIFVGETRGGDVGADLFVHRNKRGEIDSLIIENECLFVSRKKIYPE